MDMYKMEMFEIMAEAMEEVREWEDYEADMAEQSDDYNDFYFEGMYGEF